MTSQSVFKTKEKKDLKAKKKVNRKALAIAGATSVVFILLVVFIIIRFSKESGKAVKDTHRKAQVGGVTEDAASNGRDITRAHQRPNPLPKTPVGESESAGAEDEAAREALSSIQERPEEKSKINHLLMNSAFISVHRNPPIE